MKYIKIFSVLTIYITLFNNLICQNSNQHTTANDSLYTAILINHLRNNFDDIHDVSMRFHHKNHTLNGLIVIGLHWENGRLGYYSIERNDTNDENFANVLAENIEKWYIKDLVNPFNINLPLNIQIVGNNDSTFAQKGIFTGKIVNKIGNPIKGVKLNFISPNCKNDTLRSIYSNREGIFVKTLIPVGNWNIYFEADGFDNIVLEDIKFKEGEHVRKNISIVRNK